MLFAALFSIELLFRPNVETAKTATAAMSAMMSAYSTSVPPEVSESIVRRHLVMRSLVLARRWNIRHI